MGFCEGRLNEGQTSCRDNVAAVEDHKERDKAQKSTPQSPRFSPFFVKKICCFVTCGKLSLSVGNYMARVRPSNDVNPVGRGLKVHMLLPSPQTYKHTNKQTN
jgi:hypothetical protein